MDLGAIPADLVELFHLVSRHADGQDRAHP